MTGLALVERLSDAKVHCPVSHVGPTRLDKTLGSSGGELATLAITAHFNSKVVPY